jgi:hypothetical protein
MGISDRHQLVCFAFAFWNGRDPILKERLLGLGMGFSWALYHFAPPPTSTNCNLYFSPQ